MYNRSSQIAGIGPWCKTATGGTATALRPQFPQKSLNHKNLTERRIFLPGADIICRDDAVTYLNDC